jgi:hypothetical protein
MDEKKDPWLEEKEEAALRRRVAEIRSRRSLVLQDLTEEELLEAARKRPGDRDVDGEVCRRFWARVSRAGDGEDYPSGL